ncbi:hypothetical protein [Mesorhizobium sp. CAU 1741]|uniref:general secretion pathway protein GspK n=1 Tax=Mesorhizobium sp. CAU 1741 TaxID=3140366 RepID=UPI00325AF9FE
MRSDARSDGFILYTVLGMVALLSTVFVTISIAARNSVEGIATTQADLADNALLQAGLHMAGYQLVVLRRTLAAVDGQEIRLDGGVVRLGVSSDAGKADLNGSDRLVLAAAYRASGLEAMEPETFAARIIDWRDADDTPSPGGAEQADYGAAGLPFGPGNRAFASIEELRWVLGVSVTDIEALSGLLTVFNPLGRLSLTAAEPRLVAALEGMDETRMALIDSARDVTDPAVLTALLSQLAESAQFFSIDPPTVFRVSIAAEATGSARRAIVEAVIIPPVDDGEPFLIADWKRRVSG